MIYNAQTLYPRSKLIPTLNPVGIFNGGINFTPYNMSFMWPDVPLALILWSLVRHLWGDFWGRYNYLLSAALTTGVALGIIILFFSLNPHQDKIDHKGAEMMTSI